jgi:hypothetical protein
MSWRRNGFLGFIIVFEFKLNKIDKYVASHELTRSSFFKESARLS